MAISGRLTSVFGDLRYGFRALARAKSTTAVLLLSLAVGTGANAVLYSAMDALLFRPPAGVVQASRLVTISTSEFNGSANGLSSYPDFLALHAEAPSFRSIAAFDDAAIEDVELGDSTQRVRVVEGTAAYFATLGVTTHAGHLPARGDQSGGPQPEGNQSGGNHPGGSQPAAIPTAVISAALWTTFGRPADVVGQPLRVGSRAYVVAGVAPEGFRGLRLGRACDVWVPLDPQGRLSRGDRRLSLIARLADRVDVAEGQRQTSALASRLAARFPETNRGTRASADEIRRFTVLPYSRADPSAAPQQALLGAVALGATAMLLVSACVNAASLLASRSAARRRELAVKVALGASRGRLVRQALVEGLLIACGGAILGLLLAHWTAGILPSRLAPEEAEMLDTSLGVMTITVTLLFSLVAGAVFTIGPARHVMTTLDVEALRADAGGVSTDRGGAPLRAALVIGQVALSTMLLIGAGLLTQALSVALDGDPGRGTPGPETRGPETGGGDTRGGGTHSPGIRGPGTRGVAIARVEMPTDSPRNATRGTDFQEDALEAARKSPGTAAAGWVMMLPVGRSTSQRFEVEVRPELIETADVETNVASAGYFRAMRLPVIEGRTFDTNDRPLSPLVVVIDDVLAQRYFGSTAVGRTLRDADGTGYEIVGVVQSARYRTFQEASEPTVYFPLSQRGGHQMPLMMHIVVSTTGPAGPVLEPLRERLLSVDGGARVVRTMTLEDHLAQALTIDRVMTAVVAACGLLALVLSTMGVYGVIADAVRRRTREIGLRIALGARRRAVVALVFREGLYLTAAGAFAGTCAAVALARIVRAFVHGLPSLDIVSLAVVSLTLVLVVVGAAVLPTWRALRISPTIALRAE